MRKRDEEEKARALPPPLRIEAENAQAWQGEQLLNLTPKAFAVLHYLSIHAGRLVTKDELMQTIWADTIVTDGALATSIRELRKALHDDAQRPQYIETVHRRGYRWVAETRDWRLETRPVFPLVSSPRSQASPLVGREAELTRLRQQLAKAFNGTRQLLFVTGEPGIGKTTLVETFLCGIHSPRSTVQDPQPPNTAPRTPSPDPWFARGQCIEHYGAGEAYLPVLEALGRLCRSADGERLIALLNQHAPTWLVQMPALLSPPDYEALQRRTQGATRERMLRELAEALEVITAERPLILVLEDLHWSDPSTLDLLSMVARRSEPARLLIIGTYRPVDVIAHEHPLRTVKAELQLHGHCQELALELLSEATVTEYLVVRLDIGAQQTALVHKLARLLHQRTEGNPLFLVAMVEDLITRGVVGQTEGGWELREESVREDEIPESIRQLVVLQRKRLAPETQHLLGSF